MEQTAPIAAVLGTPFALGNTLQFQAFARLAGLG